MTIISPATFGLLFYSIIFLIGIDLTISGILVLKAQGTPIKKPKLLGLWIIQTMGVNNKSAKHSKLLLIYMSVKSMAVWSLFGGILILLGSSLMVINNLTK